MPLFYHKYVNYVLAHSVNYVITLYKLAPPVAPNTVTPTALLKALPPLAPHQPSQNRTIPRKLPIHLPYERPVCFASCKTSGVQLRASMPLYERSVGFASLRNSGRSTSGIHARPLSKVRCCRPKKIRTTTGGIASRCTEYCHSHNHLKSTVIPCSAPHSFIHCQRWGTVRQIALSVACNYI